MKDTIIKGTGNSRYLKSNIPADITHEQLVQLPVFRLEKALYHPVVIDPEGVQRRTVVLHPCRHLQFAEIKRIVSKNRVKAQPIIENFDFGNAGQIFGPGGTDMLHRRCLPYNTGWPANQT